MTDLGSAVTAAQVPSKLSDAQTRWKVAEDSLYGKLIEILSAKDSEHSPLVIDARHGQTESKIYRFFLGDVPRCPNDEHGFSVKTLLSTPVIIKRLQDYLDNISPHPDEE